MIGKTLPELGFTEDLEVHCSFVKTPVFPFVRFPGVDTLLGPEMKSTGEVMGGAETFGSAFAKAQMGAGQHLPQSGTAFISVNNRDKANVVPVAQDLVRLGFKLVATRGTAAYLRAHGLDADILFKINEGRPHVGDESAQQAHSARHQHAARPRVVLRRSRRAQRGDAAGRAGDHDADRRRGGGLGD
jgi:carbamoyl-phosphate synthase large subunit